MDAETIAERAGVSQRSVYNHFSTARDLVAGMYERGAERLAPLFEEMPSPNDPFDVRVHRWAEVSARILDAIAAMRWRALQAEEAYPELQPELRTIREQHAQAIKSLFPELDRSARAAVIALTDSLGWRALRKHQGMGISEASRVIAQTVRRLAG